MLALALPLMFLILPRKCFVRYGIELDHDVLAFMQIRAVEFAHPRQYFELREIQNIRQLAFLAAEYRPSRIVGKLHAGGKKNPCARFWRMATRPVIGESSLVLRECASFSRSTSIMLLLRCSRSTAI